MGNDLLNVILFSMKNTNFAQLGEHVDLQEKQRQDTT